MSPQHGLCAIGYVTKSINNPDGSELRTQFHQISDSFRASFKSPDNVRHYQNSISESNKNDWLSYLKVGKIMYMEDWNADGVKSFESSKILTSERIKNIVLMVNAKSSEEGSVSVVKLYFGYNSCLADGAGKASEALFFKQLNLAPD